MTKDNSNRFKILGGCKLSVLYSSLISLVFNVGSFVLNLTTILCIYCEFSTILFLAQKS